MNRRIKDLHGFYEPEEKLIIEDFKYDDLYTPMHVRFIVREGEHVLQQYWYCSNDPAKSVWKDVEIVEE